ncbi:MAG: DUF4864 domain-containing protein, partial [Burkholderiales bacterium]
VIEQQLQTFQRDDAEAAFSYASPNIRKLFQTSANFIAMVKSDNTAVVAIYTMEQQEDGTWKIDGCELTPSGEIYA